MFLFPIKDNKIESHTSTHTYTCSDWKKTAKFTAACYCCCSSFCLFRSIFMIEYQHLLSALDLCIPILFSIVTTNDPFSYRRYRLIHVFIRCPHVIHQSTWPITIFFLFTPDWLGSEIRKKKIDMTDMISVFFAVAPFRFIYLFAWLYFSTNPIQSNSYSKPHHITSHTSSMCVHIDFNARWKLWLKSHNLSICQNVTALIKAAISNRYIANYLIFYHLPSQ